MLRLERLGWTHGIAFTAFGRKIGIRVNQAAALEQALELLPPGAAPARAPYVERMYSLRVGGETALARGNRRGVRQFHLLFAGLTRVVRSMDLEEAMASLAGDLKLYVAETAARRVFVHAGVVGWRGQAIVLPGSSHSGKTTLVAELVRAGATYYSDEYAVLDARGRVHPYARPLEIRREGLRRMLRCPVEELNGRAGRKPLPPGLVVVTTYQPGTDMGTDWKPAPLTQGQGMLELLAHTVCARQRSDEALRALRQATARTMILRGTRGAAAVAARDILRLADEYADRLASEGKGIVYEV
ncbi:MAG: hypothetical protein ACKV2V_23090 [Blastocatellia bacterium]